MWPRRYLKKRSMNNIIGLKGTSEERHLNWLSMRTFRQTREIFADARTPQEIRVKDLDERLYGRHLSEYVG